MARCLSTTDRLTAQVEREGLVGDLQARYQRLYEIANDALRYRGALRVAIRELSAGKDRASVLAELARWEGILRGLKRTAGKIVLAACLFLAAPVSAGEFETNYAITCQRYANWASTPQLSPVPVRDENWVSNGRFKLLRDINWPSQPIYLVPQGGIVYPDMWRVAPGPGASVRETVLIDQAPPDAGYGNVLSLQWVGEWRPDHECGAMFLEHYIYNFDELAGHVIEYSFWVRIQTCCIQILPAIWLNYHNNDYEFLFGPGILVTEQWQQVRWYVQLPSGAGHVLSPDRYVALGITTTHSTSPWLYLAGFKVARAGATVVTQATVPSPIDLIKLESDLAGLRDALTEGAGIVEGLRTRVRQWEAP